MSLTTARPASTPWAYGGKKSQISAKNADFKKVYEHGQAVAAATGLKTAVETFNPVIVDFYEQVGYLPDAILNYLILLGWSLDDKSEYFTRQEMIDLFSLERVNKAAPFIAMAAIWALGR